jgi:drug/metabolite transporter (DMT)-like permease
MDTAPGRGRTAAAFAAVYLIWGSTYLSIRIGLETLPPFLMAGARFFTAGLLLYGWRRARGAARPAASHWRAAALVGLGLLVGGNGLVTWAELTVPSGVAALMVATVPLWMALLQGATDRTFRPGPSAWAGVLLGFAGIAVLSGAGAPAGGRLDPRGVAVLLAASVCWASASLYSRRAALPGDTLLSVGMQMLSGGAGLLLAGFLRGERVVWSAVSARSAWALAYLILLGAVVGFTCYAWLLRNAPPVAVSSYAYVNPVVALFLGWAFAGEPLTPRVAAAAAAVVAAVVLMSLPRRPDTFHLREASDI